MPSNVLLTMVGKSTSSCYIQTYLHMQAHTVHLPSGSRGAGPRGTGQSGLCSAFCPGGAPTLPVRGHLLCLLLDFSSRSSHHCAITEAPLALFPSSQLFLSGAGCGLENTCASACAHSASTEPGRAVGDWAGPGWARFVTLPHLWSSHTGLDCCSEEW